MEHKNKTPGMLIKNAEKALDAYYVACSTGGTHYMNKLPPQMKKHVQTIFKSNIAFIRYYAGFISTGSPFTQDEFAKRLSVSGNTLRHWENGERIPNPASIYVILSTVRILFGFDLTYADLMCRSLMSNAMYISMKLQHTTFEGLPKRDKDQFRRYLKEKAGSLLKEGKSRSMSLDYLKQTIKRFNVPVAIIKENCDVIYSNRACTDLMKTSTSLYSMFPEQKPAIQEFTNRLINIKNGNGVTCILANKHKDGTLRSILHLSGIPHMINKEVVFMVYFMDISNLSVYSFSSKGGMVKDALNVSALIDNKEYAVLVWKPKTGLITHTKHLFDMIGVDSDTPMRTHADFIKIIHPDDVGSLIKTKSDYIADIDNVFELQYRIMDARDKTYIWIRERSQVMQRDNEGVAELVVCTLTIGKESVLDLIQNTKNQQKEIMRLRALLDRYKVTY